MLKRFLFSPEFDSRPFVGWYSFDSLAFVRGSLIVFFLQSIMIDILCKSINLKKYTVSIEFFLAQIDSLKFKLVNNSKMQSKIKISQQTACFEYPSSLKTVIGCPFALRNYRLSFLVDLLVLPLALVQAKFSPAIRAL